MSHVTCSRICICVMMKDVIWRKPANTVKHESDDCKLIKIFNRSAQILNTPFVCLKWKAFGDCSEDTISQSSSCVYYCSRKFTIGSRWRRVSTKIWKVDLFYPLSQPSEDTVSTLSTITTTSIGHSFWTC